MHIDHWLHNEVYLHLRFHTYKCTHVGTSKYFHIDSYIDKKLYKCWYIFIWTWKIFIRLWITCCSRVSSTQQNRPTWSSTLYKPSDKYRKCQLYSFHKFAIKHKHFYNPWFCVRHQYLVIPHCSCKICQLSHRDWKMSIELLYVKRGQNQFREFLAYW